MLNEIMYIWHLVHSGSLLTTYRKCFFIKKKKSVLIQPNQTSYILFDLQAQNIFYEIFFFFIKPAIVKI